MNQAEYSLVVFTVLSQLSVGLVIMLCAFDLFSAGVRADQGNQNYLPSLSLGVIFSIALGMFASLLHLGVPAQAHRAVVHWHSSWLSREIIIFGLYFALAIAYAYLWWQGQLDKFKPARLINKVIKKFNQQKIRLALGVVVAAVGIVGVYFSANIYRIPTRPVWNSYCLFFTFLSSTLNLGALGALVCFSLAYRYRKGIAAVVIIFGVIRLCVGVSQHLIYYSQFRDLAVFAALPSRLWTVLSLLSLVLISLTVLVSAGLILRYSKEQKKKAIAIAAWVAFALVLAGEMLNRAVFFMAGIHLPIG